MLSQHLWLGGSEAESTAAALAPKLRKGRDGLQKLLFDVVALEVWWRRPIKYCKAHMFHLGWLCHVEAWECPGI